MIKSQLCELLGIRYPLFQGGMAWIADGKLAAAVSEGGGLGIIGAGSAPASWVREQIRIAKALTDKPFGVNIMLMSPFADEIAQVVAEEQVAVVTSGVHQGDPCGGFCGAGQAHGATGRGGCHCRGRRKRRPCG